MKLSSVETISEVRPHPNADKLDLVKVLGWQCVVKRGEFHPGARVVFVYTDTVLPPAPWSEFLKDKTKPDGPIRLKTVKLRGEYSSGLVLPLSVLPEEEQSLPVGSDVGSLLGIEKYVKPVPANLAGEVLGPFPQSFVPRTDEDNGLSDPHLVTRVLAEDIMVTLKVDGTSMTCIIEEGQITQVCSRNLSLKETENNTFWQLARALRIPEGFTGAIQGEVCGPKIQGNQLGLAEPSLFVFQIKDAKACRYLTFQEMRQLCTEILGCNHVTQMDYRGDKTLESLQAFADSLKLPSGAPAEGIVVRHPSHKSSGSGRPLGFKLINRNFKD